MATEGDSIHRVLGDAEKKRKGNDIQVEDTSGSSKDQFRHELDGEVPEDGLYQASDCFADRMGDMIRDNDIQRILESQVKSASRFEKTNEKFKTFNELSTAKYESLHQHFKSHTKMLIDMKKDLDSVFRRIRTLKVKLNKTYPNAFIATSENIRKLEKEREASGEEEEVEGIKETVSATERKKLGCIAGDKEAGNEMAVAKQTAQTAEAESRNTVDTTTTRATHMVRAEDTTTTARTEQQQQQQQQQQQARYREEEEQKEEEKGASDGSTAE